MQIIYPIVVFDDSSIILRARAWNRDKFMIIDAKRKVDRRVTMTAKIIDR